MSLRLEVRAATVPTCSVARGLLTSVRVSAVGVAGRAAKLATLLVLARAFGAADFGKFASAFSVVMFAAFVPLLGADHALLRYVSPVRDDEDLVRAHLRRTAMLVTILSLLTAGGLALGAPAIARLLGYGADFTAGLRLMLLILVPYNALVVSTSCLLALRRPVLASVVQDLVAPLATLAASVALVALGIGWEAASLAYLFAFVLALRVALSRLGGRGASGPPASGERVATLRQLVGFGAPVMAIGLLAFGAFALDTPLVAAVRGAPEAGVYAVASRLATYATILQFGVVAVFVPAIADHAARQALEGVGALVKEGTRLLLGVVAPFAIAVMLLSGELMRLFGEDFERGRAALAILLLAHAAATTTLLSGYALVMLGRQALDLLNHVGLLIVVLGCGYVIGRHLGTVGVAATVAAGSVGVNLVKYAQLRRSVGHFALPSRAAAAWGALAAVAILVVLLDPPPWFRGALAAGIALAGIGPLRRILASGRGGSP